MSKELEALKRISKGFFIEKEDLHIVEQALKRLAKIDDLLEEIGIDENDLPIWFEMQKQDGKKVEALEIIKTDRDLCKFIIFRLEQNHTKKETESLKEVLL